MSLFGITCLDTFGTELVHVAFLFFIKILLLEEGGG